MFRPGMGDDFTLAFVVVLTLLEQKLSGHGLGHGRPPLRRHAPPRREMTPPLKFSADLAQKISQEELA